jgi:hypothetical protein
MNLSVYHLNKKMTSEKTKKPSGDLLEAFAQHLAYLQNNMEHLNYSIEILNTNDRIWPDQREYILTHLIQIAISLSSLYQLSNDSSKLPLLVRSKRYTLLLMLKKSTNAVKAVKHKIENYKANSTNPIQDKMLIAEEIRVVINHYGELETNIHSFMQTGQICA